jgi:hypothetical protein
MARMIDITGQRFGRLLVVRRVEADGIVSPWLCTCDCGNSHVAESANIRAGRTRSCGCLQLESIRTHNDSDSAEYIIWTQMIQRCTNPHDSAYKNYGGRGIGIANIWRGPGGYERFLAHVGRRPTKRHTIDREDNDRGYEPGNVRWATRAVQLRNTRRTRMITFKGKTMCVTDWATRLGIPGQTLSWRVLNWPLERAMTEAIHPTYPRDSK